ncbi:MAG TPA: glycosyltransferase family 1 protein [Acidimicrobiales bacterium]|nr:glycosyltransferase family 1 protein [Acidimicrobiales bacterium]
MKVALDVSAVPAQVAGAGRYIVEVARRLPERNVTTTLVTRRDDTERWAAISPAANLAALVPSSRATRLAVEAYLLGASATAKENDVWHAPHYTMPRRHSTPCVVTIHDLTFFTNPEWHERSKVAFFRRAITFSVQHASVLISVSDFTARLIEETFPQHAPIVVAPLGVELDVFTPDSSFDGDLFERHGLPPPGSSYILFVGTVEPRKGLDLLLDAFSAVARQDDVVELWLCGQVGWGEGPVEEVLRTHPYGARIRRLGFVHDDLLPGLYRGARVVAYPSRGEGFGLPVLEAMACGATVVTSADTVMAEVAGDEAYLTPVGDASALADALVVALDETSVERAERGVRARRRASSFTWERCLDQHQRAYDLALS